MVKMYKDAIKCDIHAEEAQRFDQHEKAIIESLGLEDDRKQSSTIGLLSVEQIV